MDPIVFRTLVLAVLLGAAGYGYLRAARTVGDHWRVRGRWWSVGIVSTIAALVFVAVVFREAAGALVIAAVAIAALWLPSVLRRRSRPGA